MVLHLGTHLLKVVSVGGVQSEAKVGALTQPVGGGVLSESVGSSFLGRHVIALLAALSLPGR